jgi:hypothetical protein
MRWIVPLLIAIAPASSLSAQPVERMSYVLMTGHDGSTVTYGSTDDFSRAEALRGGASGLLFVRLDGAAYVIRDPALLRRAEAIMHPQEVLGRLQGELGRHQGELGRLQSELGAEQGRLGALMAASTPRQMAELGAQQGELGSRQSALGGEQGILGQRQGELGREQARLAELAQPQIRALLNEAIQRGVAQRVD